MDAEKLRFVQHYGYDVFPRDPAINPEFPGSYMAVDCQGPVPDFAIVGDDPAALLDEMYECVLDMVR